jgi:glutamine kinase
MRPLLGTKAQTLESLTGRLESAFVLPLEWFTVERWSADPEHVLSEILASPWANRSMIVRSSALSEDGASASLAGKFESVANVFTEPELRDAIAKVISSYGPYGDPGDQVLVQPMAQVERAGVAFSVDMATGAPYRVIEWVEGDHTDAVTSGRAVRTYIRAREAHTAPLPELEGVFDLVDELEVCFPGCALDVEFGIINGEACLFQVRRAVVTGNLIAVEPHTELIRSVAGKVKEGMRPDPFLHGRRTVYGVMPDWNPAEIIGIRPRPLALSLYRELITDSIWAYQRNNYGYKNLRSHPLMRHFHGLPYIDTRVSFNSLVPRDLTDDLADRLVDYYLDQLEAEPALHDKVEFDVVLSCYSLDLRERLEEFQSAGFSVADCSQLQTSLRDLTNRIIQPESGLWRADSARIETLTLRRGRLYDAESNTLTTIYWLLEDCKRYGTLPFAGLARAGFIAVQMLRSLVSVGVLDESEHDWFMNSLETVGGRLAVDFSTLGREEFLSRYGHLRPGTYDILSPRYDEEPDKYFDWKKKPRVPRREDPFELSPGQVQSISKLLQSNDLKTDVSGFFEFLQAGIELRESSKFEFTRNVSDALMLIGDLGEEHGFTRDDMSYATVHVFRELYAGSADPKFALERAIEDGRRRYSQTCSLALPPVIVSEADVWGFEVPVTDPNFVTQKRVTAEVADPSSGMDIEGRIVCIPSADPGFDWLFPRQIAGLVTAYGGANSHMAIRANELGLPAVIGAGETNFRMWSEAKRLSLDCANRKVEVLG